MSLNRRRFCGAAASWASAGALASALGSKAAAAFTVTPETSQPGAVPDWNAVHNDFPWVDHKLWLSAADYHPIGLHSRRAAEAYYAEFVDGPGAGGRLTGSQRNAMREMFGKLINAKPEEIAFVASTTDGENVVVGGMELLVSMALVSNINGYLHDARTTSAAAHAHGAYVYADIIQGAGAIPIDVKALGIDCAACGTYKWLGGDRGFAFLYVRQDLQDRVVKRSRYGASQFSNPNNAQADSQFELLPGAMMYECSNVVAEACGAATHASLKYIYQLGIHNIRAHAKPLIDLLQKEMPRLGYPPITSPETPTSVVSFLAPDYAGMNAKLKKAFGYAVVAPKRWEFTHPSGEAYVIEGVRISPSIYNNENDIHRLLDALS